MYDSQEELYFSWYLEELANKNVIVKWDYHPKPFILSDRIIHTYSKKLKTKSIIKDSVILNDHKYQADFLIHWNPEWNGLIFMNLDEDLYNRDFVFIAQGNNNFSVVDVKGTFSGPHNNSAVTFPLDQKWVYQKYGIYVQKIMPSYLFKESFTPIRYLLTDESGRARKLDYKPISITQYLESIKQ
jgi:hypothetical protein